MGVQLIIPLGDLNTVVNIRYKQSSYLLFTTFISLYSYLVERHGPGVIDSLQILTISSTKASGNYTLANSPRPYSTMNRNGFYNSEISFCLKLLTS